MKKNILRLSLALIALGLNTTLLAAGSPFCVTVPNQQGGFTVGADILWLRPNIPTLTYSAINTTTTPNTTTTNLFIINPSYHWAFDLMAAYRIPCTGNDITALWTHLSNTSDSGSESHPSFVLNQANQALATVTTDATAAFKYDAVDLDLGQRVNFGDYFLFRMFTGVRGADVKTSIKIVESATAPGFNLPTTVPNQNSEFKGIGPQAGLEGRYCLGYGFGIDAGSTLSALVGRVDNDASIPINVTTTSSDTENISVDKRNRVVPALDMNLGLDYTFNFNNCSRSSLAIQAGYKVIHYWGVNDSTFDNVTDSVQAGFNTSYNLSLDGPYIGIKVNV